jgi:hypothetical protein
MTDSAIVFLTVNVTTPFTSELPLATEMVEVALLPARVTVFPDIRLLLASFKVTVIVDVVVLSATTLLGDAITVQDDALTAPAVTVVLVPVFGASGLLLA